MRGVWTILLIGCGFHASNPVDPDARPGDDGTVVLNQICSSIASSTPQFGASACAMPTTARIDVATTTSIDTDRGTSSPTGLTCVKVDSHDGNDDLKVCVLVAPTIIIEPDVVLSAHGSYALALFAHSVTIRGTVDVASHIGGAIGAASLTGGCITGTLAHG